MKISQREKDFARRYVAGQSKVDIAKEYGLSRQAIGQHLSKKDVVEYIRKLEEDARERVIAMRAATPILANLSQYRRK
jgi:predicted transcriptional regulator